MTKSRVILVKCDTYDDGAVYEAVWAGIDLLGGISGFVRAGENMLIKPNVLFGAEPEKCIGTHPAVFRAVGMILKQAGAVVSYGDSPGFGRCESNMRKAGLKVVADELGITLADFDRGRVVTHNGALLNKRFALANGALAADGLVSLPKLKAHGLTRLTGAVKNQFGCIPGLLKSQFHVKMADPYEFATMLVDLNTLLRPRLYVMDGIIAMEGNGPRSGRPRKLGVLLFSSDPVALDAVAARLIDLDPECIPTSRPGEKAGLGTYHAENIEIVGEDIEPLIVRDFDVVRKPPLAVSRGRIMKFVRNRTCPRPVIDETVCTNCGTCVRHCPVNPGAVDWHNGSNGRPPTYKYERCIRCFCCQELCPEGAISIRETLLGRLVFR